MNQMHCIILVLFLLLLPYKEVLSQKTSPSVSEVRIVDVTARGKGCPKDKVSITILNRDDDPSGTADYFVIGYETFGVLWPGKNKLNTCSVFIKLQIPKGYSFAYMKVKTEGFAYVPEGMSGEVNSVLKFVGKRATGIREIPGGFNDEFSELETTLSKKIWSPCKEVQEMQFSLAVELKGNPKDTTDAGTIDIISSSGTTKAKERYTYLWKKC